MLSCLVAAIVFGCASSKTAGSNNSQAGEAGQSEGDAGTSAAGEATSGGGQALSGDGGSRSGQAGSTAQSGGEQGQGGGSVDSGGAQGQGGSTAQAGGSSARGGQSGQSGAAQAGTGSGEGGVQASGGSAMGGQIEFPEDGPPAGNPDGNCDVPAEAGPEDVSHPDHTIGNGDPDSCRGDDFIAAVAEGGVITFDCGPNPITITLDRPAKMFNDQPDVVIDGGGLVALSGGGTTRILYLNTCDENQVWATEHCDDQDHPHLSVQNLTFINANSKNETEYDGGGAIYASGGRLKVNNCRFFNNVCADEGPDLGGAGIRAFQQYQGLPVYVVNSTFGGAPDYGNTCSNGGGISSIGVSWSIYNSVLSYNHAIGYLGNPPEDGTVGGGSGGAIYNDGDTMTLNICGSLLEHNDVRAYGSAIFFVSNDHSGDIVISDSIVLDNTGGGWNTLPSISMHEDTEYSIERSTIENLIFD